MSSASSKNDQPSCSSRLICGSWSCSGASSIRRSSTEGNRFAGGLATCDPYAAGPALPGVNVTLPSSRIVLLSSPTRKLRSPFAEIGAPSPPTKSVS